MAYHDPHVPTLDVVGTEYESVELTHERLQAADCVVLVTDHSAFDVEEIATAAPLVFDTRNATEGLGDDGIVRL